MHFILTVIAAVGFLAGEVIAHGYVPLLRINGKDVAGWDISKGDCETLFQLHRLADKPVTQIHTPLLRYDCDLMFTAFPLTEYFLAIACGPWHKAR